MLDVFILCAVRMDPCHKHAGMTNSGDGFWQTTGGDDEGEALVFAPDLWM